MTPHQRRVIAAVAAVVGAVLLALVVSLVVGGGDDSDDDELVVGTTSSTSSTSTSAPDVTTTSVGTTTAAPPPPTTRPAAASTTAAPTTTQLGPPLSGQGAQLRAPEQTDEREMTESGCESLADVGWAAECDTTRTLDAELAWLVETRAVGLSSARRAYVFRRVSADRWRVVLQAFDDNATRYTSIRVAVLDVSGRGRNEIAFGFRHLGAGGVLSVDLVEGAGRVAVHRELNAGSARVSAGQLDTWSTESADAVRHEVIRFVQSAWRVTSSVREAPPAPPSQL